MADTRMAAALFGAEADTPQAREFLSTLRADQVAPVVAYLCRDQCQVTRTTFSAFRGRVAALQIGITHGWFSPGAALSAEDVTAHLSDITNTDDLLVPTSLFDEMELAAEPS